MTSCLQDHDVEAEVAEETCSCEETEGTLSTASEGSTTNSSRNNKPVVCPSVNSTTQPSNSNGRTSPEEEVVILLRDLVQTREWDTLLDRLRSDTTEASLQDERGRTALHHACAVSDGDFPPLHTVKTILNSCVAAAWTPDDFGWTPLSLACSNNAPEDVIRLLLNVHEAPVSMQTHCGMTPLYLATWSRAPMTVMEMLLQVGPGLVLWPTIVEETPLTLFWQENRTSLLMALDNEATPTTTAHNNTSESTKELNTSEEDWQRLELLLKAACFESIEDPLPENMKFRALHAACAIGCPLPLIQAVMKRYPQQIWERDEYGRLPLTIAAGAPVYAPPSKDSPDDDDDNDDVSETGGDYDEEDDEGDSIDLEGQDTTTAAEDPNPNPQSSNASDPNMETKSTKQESVVNFLYHANPLAAKVPDPYGRPPLYLAIESKKAWHEGLNTLLEASPEALTSRDNVTHMYPFMLAAVEDLQSLDVVFQLLVASPQALRSCMGWKQA